ncbi:MAG TPA: DNA polymerase III subunit delta [Burkholderiaceae bacterium]|nr:DNA polymerase III subunit delta [Burkholderiaceae bacterium]
MQLKVEALAGHLARGRLGRLYCVSGDEPLLVEESLDAIRAAARAAGFAEREVLHAGGKFDWSQLTASANSLSLFAARKLVEIRLPGGKPGREGGEALRAHAAAANDDVLTLVVLPRLDRTTRNSAWASALESHGAWVEVRRVERAQLPAWLRARLMRQKQNASAETLEFLANQIEGNLLAAQQEIAKLGLLYPPGDLTLEQVTEAVQDVARFEVFDLPAAMLAGDARRAIRMLNVLRAEGAALPLVLWAISEEVRAVLRAQQVLAAGHPVSTLAREMRIWPGRDRLLEAAAARVSGPIASTLLSHCADIDRLGKGLRVPARDADPWLELAEVVLDIASGGRSRARAPSSRETRAQAA